MSKPVYFYSTRGPYGSFSNFYRKSSVDFDGRTWKSSEHAYQAMKFRHSDPEWYDRIHDEAETPRQAADMGRDTSRKMHPRWEELKYSIMKQVVKAKFLQNDGPQHVLLSTGDSYIAEHTERDKIWGDGLDGSGTNWLGKILMEVREELRNEIKEEPGLFEE